MMRELFGDRRRAFYAQARELALPPLTDQDIADFLDRRFRDTSRSVGRALTPLLQLTAGHRAGTARRLLSEFQGVWSGLPTGQRRVLAQVADNTAGLYAVSAAGGRGGSVGAALAALADRGEVVPDSAGRTGHRVVDPLLGLWVWDDRPQAWPES